jgi:ribosome biogenesis GTPase A
MMGTAEEMKELISKGTFMAFENRVYLAGACNVGKSTLASILLGLVQVSPVWCFLLVFVK